MICPIGLCVLIAYPQIAALFAEMVELWGGEVLLEGVNLWGLCLEGCGRAAFPGR